MKSLDELLSDGDLRSIGKVNDVIQLIQTQGDFDLLFQLLYHHDRLVVMRAADAIEKITVVSPQFLSKYAKSVLELCHTVVNKELQWHLAQLLPRMTLTTGQLNEACTILRNWTAGKHNSRIVRVDAMQGLFDLTVNKAELLPFLAVLEEEGVPSISARIKRLRKQIGKL